MLIDTNTTTTETLNQIRTALRELATLGATAVYARAGQLSRKPLRGGARLELAGLDERDAVELVGEYVLA